MVVAQVEMPKPRKVKTRDSSSKRVVLEEQSSQASQILNSGWNTSSERVEGKIKQAKVGSEKRNFSGEVVILEVYIAKGRNREQVRWKVPAKSVRPKAENHKCIKLPKCVGWDRTIESNCRKSEGQHARVIQVAGDAKPGCAD